MRRTATISIYFFIIINRIMRSMYSMGSCQAVLDPGLWMAMGGQCLWSWSEWANYDPDPIPQIVKKVCQWWQMLSASRALPGSKNSSYVFFRNSHMLCFPLFGGTQPVQKVKVHFGRSRRSETRSHKGWQCSIFKNPKWSNSLDFTEKRDLWFFKDFAKCMGDIWHVRW